MAAVKLLKQGWGGIKAHVLLDILRLVPKFCLVTGHEDGDQTFMSDYPYYKDCMYLFDRVYTKPESLYRIHQKEARFIVICKSDISVETIETFQYDGADKNVMADRKIRFVGSKSQKGYPESLRQVLYYSRNINETISFLTNDTVLPANIIAEIYRYRWYIEVFFKWMKQHLNIQTFYGQSTSAVSIHVYVAIITICIVALVANDHKVNALNHYELSRVLSSAITHRYWLPDLIRQATENIPESDTFEQPSLFDAI